MFKYICICCDTTRATYTQTNKIIWAISKNQAIKKFKSKPDVKIIGEHVRNTEEITTCLSHLGYRLKPYEIIDLKVPVVK